MESALKKFLIARDIPKAVIDLLENEKIDVSIIPNMEIDELQSYFPKHGDRISVLQFCRDFQNSSKIKNNLLEKLRNKMKRKPKKKKYDDDSSSLSSDESEERQRKMKLSRQTEVGWLHNGKQVRAKCGGGTRKVNISKKATKNEIIKCACDLFFLKGASKKGHISDMNIDLTDFAFNVIDSEITLEELFQQTKLSRIRCYLKTETKNISESVVDPSSECSTSSNVLNSPFNELIEDIFDDNNIQVEYVVSPEEQDSIVIDESQEVTNDNETSFGILDDLNLKENAATLILHRGNIFEDLIEAFRQSFFDHGLIKIEMILPNGEKEFAEDFGGVLRDALSEFWQTYYDRHTLGTNLKVPYIRHDVADNQLEAIAKILLRGFQCERYLPVRLAPVFLKSCFGYSFQNDELINDFLRYVSESESELVKKVMSNFDDVDRDDLIDFLSPFDTKRLPTEDNIIQLITEIAYQELVRKPSHFIRCFENVSKILSIRISESYLQEAYMTITPNSKNVLAKIKMQSENCTSTEVTVFNYLKKFIKESDEKTRAAFLRFTTGSDLAMQNITVSFINSSGYSRAPVAHTCTGLLELPSSYENFVSFRSELNSLLNSNIWIMDII